MSNGSIFLFFLVFLAYSRADASEEKGPPTFVVWSSPGLEEHYKVLHEWEGACGMVSEIEGTRLPAMDQALKLGFESALEFEGDRILNRWVIPIDTYVAAVSGPYVYVGFGAQMLKIGPEGSIEAEGLSESVPGELVACPAFVKSDFGVSDYLRCFIYHDLSTGKERKLAYEGPCT